MSKILYFLMLKPVSYLPFPLLYLISDLLYFLIYKIAGYRKSVVIANLRNSFPEKSMDEILTIQSEFYRHLCDVIVESIKLFSISEKELKRRFRIKNSYILDQMYKQDRSIILVGGHYNNWEIAAKSFDLNLKHKAVGIYSPLRDKFFETKFNESRTEFGVEIVAKAFVPRAFIANKDRVTATIFGADQSPTYSKGVHWMYFLNQKTAVHLGAEIFSMKYDYPVVFIRIDKTGRGYYEGTLEILAEDPNALKKGEITELHTRYLEKIIQENPQYWLWSHKRWKRKMTEEERSQFESKAGEINPAA